MMLPLRQSRQRARLESRPRPRAERQSCIWKLCREFGQLSKFPAKHHAHPNNGEWATARSTTTQQTAQRVTGPKYFSPRFVDVAWGAECFDHTVDLNSAGGSAATHTTSESPCSIGCPLVSDDVHITEGTSSETRGQLRHCLPICAPICAWVTG